MGFGDGVVDEEEEEDEDEGDGEDDEEAAVVEETEYAEESSGMDDCETVEVLFLSSFVAVVVFVVVPTGAG